MKLLLTLMLAVLVWLLPASPLLAADAAPTQLSVKDLYEQLTNLSQQAMEATQKGDFATAEVYWTQMIEKLPTNAPVWSNRGNARLSQNKVEQALGDYNKAVELAPDSPDPYLNRGIAYERGNQWEKAVADYNKVLEIDPKDPIAYNNRGNAEAGQGDWKAAIADYRKAADLAPAYAAARTNYALALYQDGQTKEAIQTLKNLARKYPNYADVRAALTAVLWAEGRQGEAESQWVGAVGLDARYRDLNWVKTIRRWPPAMVAALEKFLSLKS